jgi:hypothetical protein
LHRFLVRWVGVLDAKLQCAVLHSMASRMQQVSHGEQLFI